MGIEIEYPLGYASSEDTLFHDTGTWYLVGMRVPVFIVKSAGMLFSANHQKGHFEIFWGALRPFRVYVYTTDYNILSIKQSINICLFDVKVISQLSTRN